MPAEKSCAREIDARREGVESLGREERIDSRPHVGRIGDMRVRIRKAEFDRLDPKMERVGAVGGELREITPRENAERDERGEPLAVGGNLVESVSAIVDEDRPGHLGRVRG